MERTALELFKIHDEVKILSCAYYGLNGALFNAHVWLKRNSLRLRNSFKYNWLAKHEGSN